MKRRQADLRALAQAAFRAGVAAVEPRGCVARCLARRGDLQADCSSTLVVAAGKAAAAMMRGALPVARGMVLCPRGSDRTGLPAGVAVLHGGHPEPTLEGVENSRRVAAAVAALRHGETLLLLLSGGASALLEVPCADLDCDDLIAAYRVLVASGAPIDEINRVRCSLSQVKGGALAALAAPARVCTLALSDVVGDDPAAIGSGPTFPAATGGASAALEIVARYSMRMPPRVVAHLEAMASRSEVAPAASLGERVGGERTAIDYEVVAANRDASAGAAAFLRDQGCEVSRRSLPLTGTTTVAAREVARQVAALVAARRPPCTDSGNADTGVHAWLAGGETTVRVPASRAGRGGRNLDLAARLALLMEGRAGFACAVAGTDGRDGSSRAAGAVVDGGTASRAAAAGLPLADAIAAFDTEPALDAAGDLLVTGATGTNVGDLLVAVTA